MEILQGVWKQHLRPRAVVGYGVKIFSPSPPNYVTRSPGNKSSTQYQLWHFSFSKKPQLPAIRITEQPILLTKSKFNRPGYKFSEYFR